MPERVNTLGDEWPGEGVAERGTSQRWSCEEGLNLETGYDRKEA